MNKPDLSGTWAINRERSRLEIPMPDSTVFTIEHREPRFHLERTHVVGETRDVFSIELTTDGRVAESTHRGIRIEARAFWDGDVLVFDSRLTLGEEKGTNTVRYELVAGGMSFIAQERVEFQSHTHSNTWVFDRQ